jgi:hypothetical protein
MSQKEIENIKRESISCSAPTSVYMADRSNEGPSEASQTEAPIGHDEASRGRMYVTWMASMHEQILF